MLSQHLNPATTRLLLVAGLALIPPACGEPTEKRVPLFPASGGVTYQGKPLANAFVLLRKEQSNPEVPSPSAITGEDGSFALTTYENQDGAPAGDYVVTISTAPRVAERRVSLKKAEPPVDTLKGKYADPRSSGLRATIMPGTNTLEPFDLKSTGSPKENTGSGRSPR